MKTIIDMEVVFKHDFGQETYGEVRKTSEGLYRCYETPLFGGEFHEASDLFTDKESAIEYLKSLT